MTCHPIYSEVALGLSLQANLTRGLRHIAGEQKW